MRNLGIICLLFKLQAEAEPLKVHLDKDKQRVLIRGKTITVMEGCVLAMKNQSLVND